VRLGKNAGALLKKQHVFKDIVLGAESVSTAPNDVLSGKSTPLFLSFSQ